MIQPNQTPSETFSMVQQLRKETKPILYAVMLKQMGIKHLEINYL